MSAGCMHHGRKRRLYFNIRTNFSLFVCDFLSLLHVELFVTGAFVAKHIVVALFWEQVVSQPPQIRPLAPCIYTGCAFIFLRFD